MGNRNEWRRRVAVALLIIATAAAFFACRTYSWWLGGYDYVLANGAGFVAFAGLVGLVRWPVGRNICLSCAAVFFGLTLIEFVLVVAANEQERISRRTTFQERIGPLGIAPVADHSGRAIKYSGSRTVFDVLYTFDRYSLRPTEGAQSDDAEAVVFMGGSFTFGYGVGNDQTLPHYFSKAKGFGLKVVNFAYKGHGAHQMLRALELDMLRGPVSGRVRAVVYQAISDHVERSAGVKRYGLYGPRYRLGADGIPQHQGRFNGTYWRAVDWLTSHSRVRRMVHRAIIDRPAQEDMIALYVAIVARASDIAERRYGAPFLVLYWDGGDRYTGPVLEGLKANGVRVVRVSEIIPREEWVAHHIAGDQHPGPRAYKKLADHLARIIDTD